MKNAFKYLDQINPSQRESKEKKIKGLKGRNDAMLRKQRLKKKIFINTYILTYMLKIYSKFYFVPFVTYLYHGS